ncbi:COG0344 Predicted membrane protein [Rhabdaerophilaceae bacterium]
MDFFSGLAVVSLFFGYICGSVPFGLLLTRLAGTEDIRSIGSKSIGATNVLRTGRKDLAVATVLLDALKGTFAVWLASRWGISAGVVAGVGAFLGHIYPVWLRFHGGKGVATYLGVLLALWWPGLVLFAIIWLCTAALSRYSSLSALIAVPVTVIVRLWLDLSAGGLSMLAIALVAMSTLLIYKHQANISRLLAGTEGKIGQKG